MATPQPHHSPDPDGVPLCTRCLRPYDPLAYYCPHCGNAVGTLTPYIPYVNIRFEVDFYGALWRRIWDPHTHLLRRLAYALPVLLCAPLLLLALPFVLVGAWGTRRHDSEATAPPEEKPPSPEEPR